MFITVLFGPLTNFLLILFALQLPQELVLSRIPGTQFSPGLLFYLANGLIVVVNLFPHYGKIGGEKVSSDGLQLLTLPLLSKRKVNERVALGNVIDGQEWERRGNHHRAIESFNEAIQRDPSCAIAYHARGNVYQAMGDHQKTIENFDQWTLIEPESAMPYLCRGLAHFNWSKNW